MLSFIKQPKTKPVSVKTSNTESVLTKHRQTYQTERERERERGIELKIRKNINEYIYVHMYVHTQTKVQPKETMKNRYTHTHHLLQ